MYEKKRALNVGKIDTSTKNTLIIEEKIPRDKQIIK